MKGLKITLWVCAIVFLTSFIVAVLPWRVLTALCNYYGELITTAEPFTVFWFRISLMAYGMIGVFFVLLARNPLKYGEMLLLSAYGLLLLGILWLIGSIHYSFPIIALKKIIFYFILGALILLFRKKAIQENSA